MWNLNRSGAPRSFVNLAILVGGLAGLLLQHMMALANEGAFVVTVLTCSGAVFVANALWELRKRKQN